MNNPKILVVTPFWKGDIKAAELHWRLLSRLGSRSSDHIYFFKHAKSDLGPVNLPKVYSLDIEKKYPDASNLPHPAGPNLAFIEVLRVLSETDYTHFFWMEPDCIATSAKWVEPFKQVLNDFPEQAIIGTGGGTLSPSVSHWKNHFSGCSLYNVKKIVKLNWDSFIRSELSVSFDIWLSVELGYIKIGGVNNSNDKDTIIYGENRHNWQLNHKPKGIVRGMFEHWRPQKCMSKEKLEQTLEKSQFLIYHAIKDSKIIKKVYQTKTKSASAIIINYNNGKYLKDCIDSALKQNLNSMKYEVIVVDDGSSDQSKKIIQSFGEKITSVFLEHGSLGANFNQQRALRAGLKNAKGEIIFLLDGDDCFYPNKILECSKYFDDTDVVLVQHGLDLVGDDGVLIQNGFSNFPEHDVTWDFVIANGKANYFQPTSGLSFHRNYLHAQLDLLVPDQHPNVWADVRTTRFAPLFGKVISLPDSLGCWRRHAKSDSIRVDNIRERITQHEIWIDETCESHGYPKIPFRWKKILNAPCWKGASDKRWIFTKNQANGKHFLKNLLIFKKFSANVVSSTHYEARFSVKCDSAVRLAISLARHDYKTKYEGLTVTKKLAPGQNWKGVLKHSFNNNHEDLKLQFEILECPTPSCTLEILEMAVQEVSAKRPEEPIPLTPNSFAQANKLYREKNYAEAHKIYLALQKNHPELGVYQTNAQMALRRLAHKSTL
jgi:glycosyltransferase involved in cell wall biosynthesis